MTRLRGWLTADVRVPRWAFLPFVASTAVRIAWFYVRWFARMLG